MISLLSTRYLTLKNLSEKGSRPVDLVMLRGGAPLRGWNARILISCQTRRVALRSVTA